MNILIFSWRGPGHPHAGGAEIVTHEHAKAWVKAGHKVTLFTSSFSGAKKFETIDGIDVIRRGNQILGVQFFGAVWYLFSKHKKFDLVVDHFHGIPFFTPLYMRGKKMGFIHEVTKDVWKVIDVKNIWIKLFAKVGYVFEPLIFPLYKNIKFMTVSESTKKDLMDFGILSSNIRVIYNGINRGNIKKIIKNSVPTIIYLGALAKDKGIEDAIQAFGILKNKGVKYIYYIVGKGDKNYERFLKKRVRDMGMQNDAEFFGHVDEKRKFKLLSKAHVLVNPSIREGWGLVVLEAATVGTPCVAYNSPGLRDSIKQNKTGILVKDNTPKELVNNIEKLISDKDLFEAFSCQAINWSNKFRWSKSTKKSLELIESIAG